MLDVLNSVRNVLSAVRNCASDAVLKGVSVIMAPHFSLFYYDQHGTHRRIFMSRVPFCALHAISCLGMFKHAINAPNIIKFDHLIVKVMICSKFIDECHFLKDH